MNTSTIEARRMPAKRLGLFALGLAVACAGMFGLGATKAEATPTQAGFSMKFNEGLLNLGTNFNNTQILPAPSKAGDANLPDWWDIVDSVLAISGAPTATNVCTNPNAFAGGGSNNNTLYPCGGNPSYAEIRGQNTGTSNWNPTTGAITLNSIAPANGPGPLAGIPWTETLNRDVRFPIMVLASPLDGSPIPITLAATGEVTATYSNPVLPATGDGSFTLTSVAPGVLQARVLVGLGGSEATPDSPEPFTYCAVTLPELTMSTTSGEAANKGFVASPFMSGLEGAGSLQGTFDVTGDSVAVKQAGSTFTDAEMTAACNRVNLVNKGKGGVWLGNRVEVAACDPETQVGVYPDCQDLKANISKIQVTGGSKTKKGKKLTLTVKVTNSGTADESVKVKLWSSSGGVASVTGSATVSAPAGGTGTKKVTVKGKKKGKTTISATNGAKTGSKKVTVK